MPRAVKAAAEKVMSLEKDPSSENYIVASTLVLVAELSMLEELTPVQQKELVDTVTKRLSMAHPPNQDYYLALQLAMRLEMGANKPLAAQAYTDFAKAFASASDPEIAQMAKPFAAAAMRLNLIGKPIEIVRQHGRRQARLTGNRTPAKSCWSTSGLPIARPAGPKFPT